MDCISGAFTFSYANVEKVKFTSQHEAEFDTAMKKHFSVLESLRNSDSDT
jgi:hypothetical protein